MREDEVNLLDFFRSAGRSWKLLAGWTVGLAMIAALYTLVVPAMWAAHSALLLPMPDGGSQGEMSRLALMPGGPQPVSMLRAVIESRTSINDVAKATGLTAKDARAMMQIEEDLQRNVLKVSAESTDANEALKAVRTALDSLQRIEREVGFSIASKQATILGKAVETKKQELADAEDRLLAYQRGMTTIPDSGQGQTVVEYAKRLQELNLSLEQVRKELEIQQRLATGRLPEPELPTGLPQLDRWRERLREAEYQLALDLTKFNEDAPSVRRLRREVQVARDALQAEVEAFVRSMQQTVNDKTAALEAKRLVLELQVQTARELAAKAPGEAVEFRRLLRSVNTASETYRKVLTEYETARTQAEANRVRWTILDAPYVEDKPVNKGIARNAALGAAIGFILGLFAAASRR